MQSGNMPVLSIPPPKVQITRPAGTNGPVNHFSFLPDSLLLSFLPFNPLFHSSSPGGAKPTSPQRLPEGCGDLGVARPNRAPRCNCPCGVAPLQCTDIPGGGGLQLLDSLQLLASSPEVSPSQRHPTIVQIIVILFLKKIDMTIHQWNEHLIPSLVEMGKFWVYNWASKTFLFHLHGCHVS